MSGTTNIYFDFEFIDDGREIVPISVGMCTNAIALTETAPDVLEAACRLAGDLVQCDFYQEYEFDPARANDWVRASVLPYLESTASTHSMTGDGYERYAVAHHIEEWVADVCGGTKPQFIGYYPSYDWVLLCQHFGTMMQIPTGWPMRPVCLMQLADTLGVEKSEFPNLSLEHHALADAKWNRDLHTFLDARHEGDAP